MVMRYKYAVVLLLAYIGSAEALKLDIPQLNLQEQKFLTQHWQDTIPLQGKPPATYSSLEASLSPAACGTCHPQQYQDWQTTIHSKSMGPGILGQLVEMVQHDPATARVCWSCHTPNAEQQDVLFDSTGLHGSWANNHDFDPALQTQGLICAACHVRKHQRYGPPRRNKPQEVGRINEDLPHGGFSAQTAFTKSAFCASCHQFDPEDYALNGKLIENTYQEWKDSRYPALGIQCQTCHMPERRHLWRGIHDPEMVKKGITVDVDFTQRVYRPGKILQATITVTNSGAGHYFPTYMTPKIFVRGYLINGKGERYPDSLQEAIIGRDATADLSQELYDTRIPPGDSLAITYQETLAEADLQFRVEIVVYPDHFYTRFYESLLERGEAGDGRTLIEEALAHSRTTSFSVYEKTFPLSPKTEAVKLPTIIPQTSPSLLSRRPSSHDNERPDWNETAIDWHDYDSGIKAAAETGKPILLIFYADWCPTCHAYKKIFLNPKIIQSTSDFIMIRVNSDREKKLNDRYAPDGGYVPRTFALGNDGKLIDELYQNRSYPKYFMSADDPGDFLKLMGLATRKSSQLNGQ